MLRQRQSIITRVNEDSFRNEVFAQAKKLQAKHFLDLGCGDGNESIKVAELVKAKIIIGIDHEPATVSQIAKKRMQFIAGDLNQPFPLKSSSVDGILCNQAIEHIAKTDMIMSEMYRILRPKGWALICTPNLASWHNIFSLVLGWQPFSPQVSDYAFIGNPAHPNYREKIDEKQAHLRVFTRKGLEDLAQLHGLKPERYKGVGYYPLPRILNKIFARIDSAHAAYLLLIVRKK